MSRRTERINEVIREEISDLLLREIKDPRLSEGGLVSITEVTVTPDLRRATVHVSHLGSDEERKGVLAGLTKAAPFMHRELTRRLDLRHVPDLVFKFDPSIERGARLATLIHDVHTDSAADDSVDSSDAGDRDDDEPADGVTAAG